MLRKPPSHRSQSMSPTVDEGNEMQGIIKALTDQRATLQGLVEMQTDLRHLVETQHRKLESVLMTIKTPTGDTGSHPISEVERHGQGVEGTFKTSEHATSQPEVPVGDGADEAVTPVAVIHKFGKKSKEGNSTEETPPPRSDSMMVANNFTTNTLATRKQWRKRLSHPYWDALSGFCILMNFLTLFVELEWRSKELAYQIQLKDADTASWDSAKQYFVFFERFFNGVFLIELFLDLWAFGLGGRLHQHKLLMWVDRLAIVLSAFEVFVLDPMVQSEATKAVSLLRLVRVVKAVRLLRFLRVLRFMGMFSALRVLVQTLQKSVGSLLWSMAVVGFIVLSCALFVTTITQDIISNDDLKQETREWVFLYFGGAARASYTLFEAAFSGIWASRLSRPLIEEVSAWWSVWWILYGVIVNFAVVRIISALFLKQTLDVAAIDAERQALLQRKEHDQIVQTLDAIFKTGDQLGDGFLCKWEFEEMMEKEEVLEKFEALELETPELFMLFDILSEDDGKADFEEFLAGALKLKSAVRTLDIVNILHDQLVIKRYLGVLADGIGYLDKALHPENPWKPGQSFGQKVQSDLAKAATGVELKREHGSRNRSTDQAGSNLGNTARGETTPDGQGVAGNAKDD